MNVICPQCQADLGNCGGKHKCHQCKAKLYVTYIDGNKKALLWDIAPRWHVGDQQIASHLKDFHKLPKEQIDILTQEECHQLHNKIHDDYEYAINHPTKEEIEHANEQIAVVLRRKEWIMLRHILQADFS